MTPSIVVLVVFALLGSKCVLSAVVEDADQSQNATYLEEKQKADAEIQDILFGGNPVIRECMNVTFKKNLEKTKSLATQDTPVWTVMIIRQFKIYGKTVKFQQCAGSIINSRVILTAAHCVYNKTMSRYRVRAEGYSHQIQENLVKTHQERKIAEVILPEEFYLEEPKHDIALLLLKTPFKLAGHIRSVCLPWHDKIDFDYSRCSVTGWEGDFVTQTKHLKISSSVIIPKDKCEKVLQMTGLGEDLSLDNSFMCSVGESDKFMSIGNGGAPLVCPICGMTEKTIQVGILSWGFNATSLPEVFTSIAYSRRWIGRELKSRQLKVPSCEIEWKKVVKINAYVKRFRTN